MNQVTLVGRIGQDPEIRQTSGDPVCSFSLATREREKRDGQWGDSVQWHRVVCFGKTAENLALHKRKGDEVVVVGSYRSRKYTKDGVEREAWEVKASQVEYVGGRSDGGSREDRQPAREPAREPEGWGGRGRTQPPVDSDIPF